MQHEFFGAGWLLMGRHRFPNGVCANQEIDPARACFFRVAVGAGMASRKWVEEEVNHGEYSL